MFPVILLGLAVAALLVSLSRDPVRTRRALQVSWRSLLGMLPGLLTVILLLGLALALVPGHSLTRLFRLHGIAGFAFISTAGALLTIPAPVAFSLAGTLLKHGASPAILAAFITTLTMVGTITAPMEIRAFSKRFTLLRQGLSFGLAILVGALMGVILP